MLIDLKLTLEFHCVASDACVNLHDRKEQIQATIFPSQDDIELNFKFSIPNQLTFDLFNLGHDSPMVTLKQCTIGGLDLQKFILDQICTFVPSNSNQSIVMTNWCQDGKVTIDFFAGDWIQYHLIYGNKILL